MVVGEDAPDAVHVQFAEPEHFRFALDFQPGGANGVGKIWIAFLDDDAAFDAADKLGDFFQRQRMRETELEKTRVRRGFAGVHETNAGGDDAELLAAGNDLVQRRDLAPLRHF